MADEKKQDNRPYWMQRRDAKLGTTKTTQEVTKDRKDALSVWFEIQATMASKFCENCGEPLASTIKFHPRAHIAHIVPKSPINGCPSVATHPLNRWFACKTCHDIYDGSNTEKIIKMNVLPVVKERLTHFINQIEQTEIRRVPAYLLPEVTEVVEDEPDVVIPTHKIVKTPKKAATKKTTRKTRKNGKSKNIARGKGGKFVSKSTGNSIGNDNGNNASREQYDKPS